MTARPRFDEVIHAPNRLQIAALLAPVDTVEFATVRDALGVADSVLSKHVKVLQDAGYVAVRKATVGSRVRTSLALTKAGQRAFEGHVAALRALVDPASDRLRRTSPVAPSAGQNAASTSTSTAAVTRPA